jgi:hypothetical protein
MKQFSARPIFVYIITSTYILIEVISWGKYKKERAQKADWGANQNGLIIKRLESRKLFFLDDEKEATLSRGWLSKGK